MKFLSALFILAVATAEARTVLQMRAAAKGGNLQTFTGTLGGAATPVTNSGDEKRPFEVKGDTFVNVKAALQRSCDQQFNACANQANSGAAFSSADCQKQKDACTAADAGAQN